MNFYQKMRISTVSYTHLDVYKRQLLILQASCDLTLPTFTSNIVNVGIQQKGIEDAVPDVMREETFLALKSLMKQDAVSYTHLHCKNNIYRGLFH